MDESKLIELLELDKSIIASKPWARDMLQAVQDVASKAVLNWYTIVAELGEEDVRLADWVAIFEQEHLTALLELVSDMHVMKEKTLNQIEELVKRSEKLKLDLHIVESQLSFADAPLYQVRRHLTQQIEELEAMRDVRLRELTDLTDKQLSLCLSLGREPKLTRTSPLPSATELESLRDHIEQLEKEKFEREEKFIEIKSEICEIVRELNVKPSLDFEKQVLSLNDSVLFINDQNMRQLDQYHQKLLKKLTNVKEEIGELRKVVDELWHQLDVSMVERDLIREQCTGNLVDTLQVLRDEIARLREIKKADIKKFVDKQRETLIVLWNKCYCSETDRNDFKYIDSDNYTEDLLDLYEREVNRWTQYYEQNKELITLFAQYNEYWGDLLKLEEVTGDGGLDRYKNRGGQLLVEEKKRNKLTKRIPEIEARLIELADFYFVKNGKAFTVNSDSNTVQEFIELNREQFDKTKKNKLSARKLDREKKLTTPAKCRTVLFPSSTSKLGHTPQVKRKINTPHDISKSKKANLTSCNRINNNTRMVNGGTASTSKLATAAARSLFVKGKFHTPSAPSKIKVSASTSKMTASRKRQSYEMKQQRIERRRRLSQKMAAAQKENQDPDKSFSTPEYNDFMEQAASNNTAKSSLLPSAKQLTPLKVSYCHNNRKPTRGLTIVISTPGGDASCVERF